MSGSCIIKHFEHYSPLSESERHLLDSLEKSPRWYQKNTTISNQGEPSEHFYTVSKGWVFSQRHMRDGSRQVLDIYVPGDVVGLREFAFRKRLCSLTILQDAELCPFPKTRLTEVFAESSLLCNIFFTIAARDQGILLERLVNLGRRTAREKLAHFLVELSQRLEKTNAQVANHLKLPLPQTLLADALGLSTVHVNRVFQELKEEQLIWPGKGGIEIRDLEGLKKVALFEPDYLSENIEGILHRARELEFGAGSPV